MAAAAFRGCLVAVELPARWRVDRREAAAADQIVLGHRVAAAAACPSVLVHQEVVAACPEVLDRREVVAACP